MDSSQPFLSARSRNTPPSPIRRLAHLAERAKERGVDVYHLNIGQPDIDCPESFREGIEKYSRVHVAYTASEGITRLRQCWCDLLNRTLDIHTAPHEFLVTMGASEGLVFVFTVCCDPGDEIITFDPTYANYLGFAEQSGVKLVPIESSFDQGFALPEDAAIDKKVGPRTRAVLLCNPSNPTGVYHSYEEVERLLQFCRERGLYLIVDETYRELVYDGLAPFSILQMAPHDERVVVVDSISKRFSLCGARIGFLRTVCKPLMEHMLHIAQARLAAPTIEQLATTHMLETLPENYLDQTRKKYEARRDCLCEGLDQIEGVSFYKPQGAFYLLARLPIENAEDFASFMLEQFQHGGKTVFFSPARGFYTTAARGQNEIRLAFVLEEASIRESMSLLDEGLKAYRRRGD